MPLRGEVLLKDKICMVGPDPKVMGGIATVVSGYLNSSLIKEYDITYVSSYKDGNKLKKFIVAVLAYIKFIWICTFNRPNIIHIHSSFGASFYRKMFFIIIGKLFAIPIINHIHGAEFDKFYTKATSKKKKLIYKIYLMCYKIIVLSKEWKDKFEKVIDGSKIEIVENFSVVPSNITAAENRDNVVLFLGYIGIRKGAYDIPNVVKEVIKYVPNVRFILCGNGEVDKLKRIIKENNLDKNIELTGWINNKQKYELLNTSKIYFLPSYNEGLPMSILEGMSYGLPIVSTNVGGIPTVISSGFNGFIYDPGSTLEFANAILKLLKNQQLCTEIHKNNINMIVKKYSLEVNVSKISAIYHQIERM